ncbi:hypothetical protein Lgra_1345 [Legionella gratiana]|uniref:Uncharacterized protein n=1 Tax=Legionella gratiana TaxID=45066 RepID=A0A378JHQ5_9GAMM|nr:hypothetical protein [Legionella gratiana]KTD11887.1 hypothetical protein Lgra_1345 [Legionella gratiana]STX46521.1 Uncharacterised protein [Legionella gratiana]
MQAKRETLPELSFKELIALSGVAAFAENDREQKRAQEILAAYAAEKKKNAPGFFTPYRSLKDFGGNLVAPVVLPLTLGLVAGVTAIGAALGAITIAGSLLFAAGAGVVGLFNKSAKETAKDALVVAAIAGVVTAACAVLTAALAVIAAVSTPLLIASIFTRGGATVVSAVSDCFSRCFPKSEAPKHDEVEEVLVDEQIDEQRPILTC